MISQADKNADEIDVELARVFVERFRPCLGHLQYAVTVAQVQGQ
jgi:hypothetical protein